MYVFTSITLIPLISLILYSFILMVILTSNKTNLSKAFSLYVVSMIIWSAGSFLMKTDLPPNSLFWNKVLLVGFISVPVFLLRFSYVLSSSYNKMWIVRIGYGVSIVLIISSWFGFVTTSADVIDGVFVYEIGLGAYVVGLFGGFMYLLAIINMLVKVHAKQIPFKRVRLVIVGLTLVIIGAVLNLNTSLGTLGIDIIFNAINALLVTYSIYRNKFLEIKIGRASCRERV